MIGLSGGLEDSGQQPQADDPNGGRERNEVADLNERLLNQQGATWSHVLPFRCDQVSDFSRTEFQAQARAILCRLETQRPWFIEDARLSLTLPLWQNLFELPIYIVVLRDPLEIALALEKEDKIPLEAGVELWQRYTADALNFTRDAKRIFISHAEMISHPVEAIWRLAHQLEALGVPISSRPSETEIRSSIFPEHFLVENSSGENEGDTQQQRIAALECENSRLHLLLAADKNKIEPCLSEYETFAISEETDNAAPDDRFILLASLVSRLENDIHETMGQLHSRAAEAGDTLRLLTPLLRPAIRRKRNKFDELFENQLLNDRLFKKEETILRLMDWMDLMLKTIPLSSAARKAQRHYKQWRSRFKRSSIKPLRSSISRLQEDAEIRQRKSAENLTLIKDTENTLQKILQEIEHGVFFQNLEFAKIYDFAGVDKSLLGKSTAATPWLQMRDFSLGTEPLVSIVIPVHNQIGYTFGCLRSLSNVREKTPFEVIVVDDASDEKNHLLLATIQGIQVVKNEQNLGFVKSCNKGAALAQGKYTLFLNNDVNVLPGWLDSLVQTFQTHPQAGLVGSKLLYPDGTLQEAGGIIWRDGSGCNYGRNDDPSKSEYRFLRETDYCSGACIILPTDLLREVGNFDTRYSPAYYEDTDLAFKVRAAGRRIYYQPASEIIHFEGKSNGTDENHGVKKYQVLNATQFVEKWLPVLESQHFAKDENLFVAREGSRSRPTVVVLDHYVPAPDEDAGSRSTWNYIQMFLELGMKVKFIPADFFPREPYTTTLENAGVEVFHGSWYKENMRSWLIEHQRDIPFVFTNRSHITARYLDTFRQMIETKILFYGHDLGSVRNQRRFELTQNPEDAACAASEAKLEDAIFSFAHAIYYPSASETEIVLQRFPQANARTLPLNILKPNLWRYEDNLARRRNLLFVGGFGHSPNEDAVLWFLDHCWPKIEKAVPEAHFVIVGSYPTEKIEARASERVIVTGWISDEQLASQYHEARLAVIPLRYGAGVKGKVIEALHHHVPTVMTRIAAEGLPGVEEISIVQDDPEAMAQSIIALYADPVRLAKMGNAGGSYIAKHFSLAAARAVVAQDVKYLLPSR